MSTIGSVTLNDGATTPVAHTFAPAGVKNAIAKWQDRSGGISIGFPTITMSLREPTKASKVYKVTTKVVLPVLEVTSPSTSTGIQPAPTKAYDLLATVEVVMPERASEQNRKDLLAYVRNFLANAVVTNGVQTLEPVW